MVCNKEITQEITPCTCSSEFKGVLSPAEKKALAAFIRIAVNLAVAFVLVGGFFTQSNVWQLASIAAVFVAGAVLLPTGFAALRNFFQSREH